MKYNNTRLKKAENFLQDGGYVIPYKKDNFNSGYCKLEDRNVVVINKYFQTEAKVVAILDIIKILRIDQSSLSEASKYFYKKLLN